LEIVPNRQRLKRSPLRSPWEGKRRQPGQRPGEVIGAEKFSNRKESKYMSRKIPFVRFCERRE
jgi:hypothetical protein